MVLSKAVCKHCVEQSLDEPDSPFAWCHYADSVWDDGLVICPSRYAPGADGEAFTCEPPPSWCPFAAEHIVSQGIGPKSGD